MASCEKCWRDAGGNPGRYRQLIREREGNPCTPEEQAGEGAGICPKCNRKAIHQHCFVCMACGYKVFLRCEHNRTGNTKAQRNGEGVGG